MIFNYPPIGGGNALPSFEYTGQYQVTKQGSKWEIALLTSGTLTLLGALKGDLYLVGGGNAGETYTDSYFGGYGGRGGGRRTEKNLTIPRGSYTATVGTSGVASSIGSYNTSGLSGSAGGSRGESSYGDGEWSHRIVNAGSGSDGELAFGGEDCLTFPGRKFAPGGAGGGANYYGAASPGSGGTTGGGAGGSSSHPNGYDGADNTGGGGGGGYNKNAGGAGGSGIIIIRGGN